MLLFASANSVDTYNDNFAVRIFINQSFAVFMTVKNLNDSNDGKKVESIFSLLIDQLDKNKESPRQAIKEAFGNTSANSKEFGLKPEITAIFSDKNNLLVGTIGDNRFCKIKPEEINRVFLKDGDILKHSQPEDIEKIELQDDSIKSTGELNLGFTSNEILTLVRISFEENCLLLVSNVEADEYLSQTEILKIINRHPGNRKRIVTEIVNLVNKHNSDIKASMLLVEGKDFAKSLRRSIRREKVRSFEMQS
jgi:hypothetical protein